MLKSRFLAVALLLAAIAVGGCDYQGISAVYKRDGWTQVIKITHRQLRYSAGTYVCRHTPERPWSTSKSNLTERVHRLPQSLQDADVDFMIGRTDAPITHTFMSADESRRNSDAAMISFAGVALTHASLTRPEIKHSCVFVGHTDQNCREDGGSGLRKILGRSGRRGRLQCPDCRVGKRGYEAFPFQPERADSSAR